MRISEMLQAIASWLESPNNEALLLAEYDEKCLEIVAHSCVNAAKTLKIAATELEGIEPPADSKITPESIEETAKLAEALDSSDDPALKKMASVLDELLLSIAAPPNAFAERKDLQDQRLVELKKKYEDPSKELKETNLINNSEKALDKADVLKRYNILEAPLSTRYCPDHAGTQIARVGEHIWQCELDHKTYNFETGFELNNGAKVPGGDVSLQTPTSLNVPSHAIFDSREGRLSSNK